MTVSYSTHVVFMLNHHPGAREKIEKAYAWRRGFNFGYVPAFSKLMIRWLKMVLM
jgi:hypothetical protein